MKYTVKVTGEAALGLEEQDLELEASNGHEAVDAVRAHLATLLPKEGGLLEVVVSCLESWTITSPTPRGGTVTETVPPGEVSRFSFRVEPHPDVRVLADAKRSDAELALLTGDKRTAERVRLLFGLHNTGAIDQAQLVKAVTDTRSLESIVAEAAAAKVVSK